MNNLLDYALLYASFGWPVFPVHTPQSTGCSCRRDCDRIGKHPRISTGRNGATTDTELIHKWWSAWPDANIGIATGMDSGLIVLDVDDDLELPGPLPDTAESQTGSGGRHLLYRRPNDSARYRTLVRFAPGLDSRADGGYIVAPPSLHASGHLYEWEVSSRPEDVSIADAPDWFVESIRAQPFDGLTKPPEWDPDGELPLHTLEMLRAIPSDEYEIWRDVGMALHYTDPTSLDVWDWWSSLSPKYDAGAVKREWRNFSRRGHQTSTPITLSSVRLIAERHGWIDPSLEHGADVASIFLESRKKRIIDGLNQKLELVSEPPNNIIPSSGLIKLIVDYILTTSYRPQPILAVAAATTFVGALAGRKFRTETDLRTNIFAIGLAESGSGKEHARKCIDKIAMAADVGKYIGGERITSGAGMRAALSLHPCRLFLIDEFGGVLGRMTGNNSSEHQKDLLNILMTLHGAASGTMRGAEYADQKTRPREDIYQPHACIYGTTTPELLWPALKKQHGLDGTLSRFVLFESQDRRPKRNRPTLIEPPNDILELVKCIANYEPDTGNLVGKTGGKMPVSSPIVVPFDSDDVRVAWEGVDDQMDDLMENPSTRSIYSRVAEQTAKLALTHAVSRGMSTIDAEALAWGRNIAIWSATNIISKAQKKVADNETERVRLTILETIYDAGAEGITKSEMLRQLRTIRARDLSETLSTLLEAGEITSFFERTKGRRRVMYIPSSSVKLTSL